MIKVEPRINAEDYLAFQTMMLMEPAFKDAPTGVYIDFATFSSRQSIRIQSGPRPNKTIVMVSVQPNSLSNIARTLTKTAIGKPLQISLKRNSTWGLIWQATNEPDSGISNCRAGASSLREAAASLPSPSAGDEF